MKNSVVFNLFGRDGWVNPTPMLRTIDVPFYDEGPMVFRMRQGRDFDGGWRYWAHYDAEFLTIYNVNLDRRAYADLTEIEIKNTVLEAETLLDSIKGLVLVDHAFYQSKSWLEDHIRALARRASNEIRKEIRGDDVAKPHLHSVR